MVAVDVLLTGRLATEGYGKGIPRNRDHTLRLEMKEGSTIEDVALSLEIDPKLVALATVNQRRCRKAKALKAGDRVVLIPRETAAFWRFTQPPELWTDTTLNLLGNDRDLPGDLLRVSSTPRLVLAEGRLVAN